MSFLEQKLFFKASLSKEQNGIPPISINTIVSLPCCHGYPLPAHVLFSMSTQELQPNLHSTNCNMEKPPVVFVFIVSTNNGPQGGNWRQATLILFIPLPLFLSPSIFNPAIITQSSCHTNKTLPMYLMVPCAFQHDSPCLAAKRTEPESDRELINQGTLQLESQ